MEFSRNDPQIQRVFGQNLRQVRKGMSLTQEQVAGLTSIKTSTLSEIERGVSNPKLTTIWKIIRCLGERYNAPPNLVELLFKGE